VDIVKAFEHARRARALANLGPYAVVRMHPETYAAALEDMKTAGVLADAVESMYLDGLPVLLYPEVKRGIMELVLTVRLEEE